MTRRDLEAWMWCEAENLIREASKIHWSFLEAAAAARGDLLLGRPLWGPHVNVIEAGDGETLRVVAALPGVSADDVRVRIDDGEFVINGLRRQAEEWTYGRFHLIEIPCGPFERRLKLPEDGCFSIGESRLSDGLLSVELRRMR